MHAAEAGCKGWLQRQAADWTRPLPAPAMPASPTMAGIVAGSTQKSYGALDTFAEQNGRRQIALLHRLCDEVSELMPQLLNDTRCQLACARS